MKPSRRHRDVRRHGAAALVFAAACALSILAGGSAPAGAASAKELGKTKRTPSPACPQTNRRPCQATGSVTGFQREANGESNLFRAKEDGKLVAWAIDLSRPNKDEREFFGNLFESETFGKAPTAGIAVIKRTGGKKYRLKRDSPIVSLGNELGERQTFTLNTPLQINKGDILALTLPTWAPNFAVDLSRSKNTWRASRSSKKCEGKKDLKEGRPHRQVDTERVYGCDYEGSRLLYWGYYRPD